MEDGEAEAEATAEDGWLSILIATSSPSIAQWANIVQNLLCHANSAKGKSSFPHLKGLKISFHLK